MNPRALTFPNGFETVRDVAVDVDFGLDITAIHVARFRGESKKEGAEACNVVSPLIPALIERFDPEVGVVDVDVDVSLRFGSVAGCGGWLVASGQRTETPRSLLLFESHVWIVVKEGCLMRIEE